MPDNNYLSITDSPVKRQLNGHAVPITDRQSPYELRSEEVQDIMTKMPSWIIRQGTTVLFSVMVLLLAGAYFIHFPDVVTTPVHIKPVNAEFIHGKYEATAVLPLEMVGKVKPGQRVLIKLPLYPFQQFGFVEGRVEAISAGNTDTAYAVNIKLTNGLVTSTNKKIDTDASLPGIAEILTGNETILERLFATSDE